MKQRFTLTILLLVGVPGLAHAQLGIRAGLGFATFSTLNFDGAYREAHVAGRLGFQAGVFYERPLAGRWTLVPELHYSYQRQDLRVEDNSVNDAGYAARYRLSLGYVNLPLLFRATYGKWYLELGPQLGLLVNAHEKGTEVVSSFFGGTTVTAIDRSAADRYLRADLELGVGGGVQLPSGFALGLRATTGLLSLTDESSAGHGYGGSLRSQVVQLALSYQFKQPATGVQP